MRSKKGELTTQEIIEIILVAAGFIVVTTILYNLISPNWDQGDETSKAYLDSFLGQLEVADEGGIGEFFIWPVKSDEAGEVDYMVVYFGDKNLIPVPEREGRSFVLSGNNENSLCICSLLEGNEVCNACKSLDSPINLEPEVLAIKGEKLLISKEGESYEIRKA